MATRMSEADMDIVVKGFALPQDRKGPRRPEILEPLHYFSARNVTWRALDGRARQMEQGLEALLASRDRR